MADKHLKPLLVVEDNPGLQKQLKWSFAGYEVSVASDRASAIEQLKQHQPPVVTLDLGLPPDPANASEGLAALDEILKLAPHTKVIVVTGNDDRQNALKAISLGAYDFYQKPVEPEILGLIVDRAYSLFELEEENRRLTAQGSTSPLDGIVGASESILAVCRVVEKVGLSEATTLVLGESGTGKELVAQALHRLSPRRDKPFVALNCAAIPDNLLESELFGYEKGAFTGAVKQTPGRIETADGGTFFLDEIGDMPMSLQAKMLRFLQERIIERVGGRTSIPIDVRILCATHNDLAESIKEASFREDLYYRISEIVIEIPPLRERSGDRILLAQHFLDKISQKNGRSFRGFTKEARAQIDAYAWPGNVRELENKVKRAVILAEGKRIAAEDLGFDEKHEPESLNLRQARERVERQAIQRALAKYDNNVSRAAKALGVSRPSLYSLVKKLGMAEPGKP
ncbi:MAG: PEP-CTERM-box response regulator transcription factor [Gammaproteobacteria bacterium]|nr:MAG: PEP-CTERM-box response regulator transcription factor [Gammaproteobacteria bacterium]